LTFESKATGFVPIENVALVFPTGIVTDAGIEIFVDFVERLIEIAPLRDPGATLTLTDPTTT